MKHKGLFILLTALVTWSCSELKTELPAPVSAVPLVHDEGWVGDGVANVHGKALKERDWDDATCKNCHGATFAGGTSGVSCFTCHSAYPHSVAFPARRHTNYLRAKNDPLNECRFCHGPQYTGGTVADVTCQRAGCHADASGNPKSPETCNTCHGNFRAPANLTGYALWLSAAPPKSVAGDTSASVTSVGAHQKHLATGTTGNPVNCQACHQVPSSISDAGHIGPLPAEVQFGDTLANLVTGDGTVVPASSYSAPTCANTYCHGNWKLRKASAVRPNPPPVDPTLVYVDSVMVGAKASPSWTAGASAGQCYSCHGGSPGTYVPAGHYPITDLGGCQGCHGDVTDNTGRILNKAKHINGWVDLTNTYGGPRKMQ
ncbi:MAG: CxxxxCH/CxxCH domain-containing protein [Bacteroidota bacterium]